MKLIIEVSTNEREVFEYAVSHFLNMMPKLIEKIGSLPVGSKDFTYTEKTNYQVSSILFDKLHSKEEVAIRLFTPKNPFSRTIAYTTNADRGNVIYFNSRKIKKARYQDIAGTIAHEFCHEPGGFSHGGNTPFNKESDECSLCCRILD